MEKNWENLESYEKLENFHNPLFVNNFIAYSPLTQEYLDYDLKAMV